MSEQDAALREANLYFEAHREAFVREHHEEYVLIRSGETVGFFADRGEAYREGKTAGGVFLIRQCLRTEEEQQAIFHSRVTV